MEVYALDKTNINEFSFLLEASAVEAIRQEKAQAFCVKKDDRHVGALCGHFVDDREYEILSIYVLPEYRKQGVGEKLLETLGQVLGNQDANVSITFASLTRDEKELLNFLEKMDFEEYQDTDFHLFSITLEELSKTKLKSEKSKVDYPAFSEVSKDVLEKLSQMKSQGFVPKPTEGFEGPYVDQDLSTVVLKKNTPLAYAVVEKQDDATLMLSSLYVDDPENPTTLLKLLRCILNKALKKYKEDTVILLPTVNEASLTMFATIFEKNTDLEDVMYTFRKYFPAKEEVSYEDMSISDFTHMQAAGLYGDYEDPEAAYLLEEESLT